MCAFRSPTNVIFISSKNTEHRTPSCSSESHRTLARGGCVINATRFYTCCAYIHEEHTHSSWQTPGAERVCAARVRPVRHLHRYDIREAQARCDAKFMHYSACTARRRVYAQLFQKIVNSLVSASALSLSFWQQNVSAKACMHAHVCFTCVWECMFMLFRICVCECLMFAYNREEEDGEHTHAKKKRSYRMCNTNIWAHIACTSHIYAVPPHLPLPSLLLFFVNSAAVSLSLFFFLLLYAAAVLLGSPIFGLLLRVHFIQIMVRMFACLCEKQREWERDDMESRIVKCGNDDNMHAGISSLHAYILCDRSIAFCLCVE